MYKKRLLILLYVLSSLPLGGMNIYTAKKPLVFTPASIRGAIACCKLLKHVPHATPQALTIVYERESKVVKKSVDPLPPKTSTGHSREIEFEGEGLRFDVSSDEAIKKSAEKIVDLILGFE